VRAFNHEVVQHKATILERSYMIFCVFSPRYLITNVSRNMSSTLLTVNANTITLGSSGSLCSCLITVWCSLMFHFDMQTVDYMNISTRAKG